MLIRLSTTKFFFQRFFFKVIRFEIIEKLHQDKVQFYYIFVQYIFDSNSIFSLKKLSNKSFFALCY